MALVVGQILRTSLIMSEMTLEGGEGAQASWTVVMNVLDEDAGSCSGKDKLFLSVLGRAPVTQARGLFS